MVHQFHIPVLGLGFSIDTPLKVAKYGISSVVSIVDDELIERMRAHHANLHGEAYIPIAKKSPDSRARRITSYLNLLNRIVDREFEQLKQLPFEKGNELCRYFELLPDSSQLKLGYELMMEYPAGESKQIFQRMLKSRMEKGSIDVNIMAKVDRAKPGVDPSIPETENSDALAALRGFANSELSTAVTLSAGMNPRLYSYLEQFKDFFPDNNQQLKKKIILKVSDFRSAMIQAKFLAKKGLWVSEFRVESGLNCGGHAFATAGYLLGSILEEFRLMKVELVNELFASYQSALLEKGIQIDSMPAQRLSAQGGIGTAAENEFLLDYYQLDSTGWGSPFLLVPEATNVDDETLDKLAKANADSFFLSNSSPLGVLFNNFKDSSMEQLRQERILKGRPGSPCTKKYLCSNTEFTAEPICTASREYQNLKINALKQQGLADDEFELAFQKVTEKICLCEGLCSSTYQKVGILKPKESKAVAICPGPNLAYFSRPYTLDEMVGHIYGRNNLLADVKRPSLFIKELELYIDYLQAEMASLVENFTAKKQAQLVKFKLQLLDGISYYQQLFGELADRKQNLKDWCAEVLLSAEMKLSALSI